MLQANDKKTEQRGRKLTYGKKLVSSISWNNLGIDETRRS